MASGVIPVRVATPTRSPIASETLAMRGPNEWRASAMDGIMGCSPILDGFVVSNAGAWDAKVPATVLAGRGGFENLLDVIFKVDERGSI